MCNGCTDIFIKFKKVIRGAALTHANSFVEADDLIGIINLKFFSWKKNQEGDLNLRNAFFYTIAKNAAIGVSPICLFGRGLIILPTS